VQQQQQHKIDSQTDHDKSMAVKSQQQPQQQLTCFIYKFVQAAASEAAAKSNTKCPTTCSTSWHRPLPLFHLLLLPHLLLLLLLLTLLLTLFLLLVKSPNLIHLHARVSARQQAALAAAVSLTRC